MQYTIRNIPRDVDRALRKKAKAEGTSINQAALEALRAGVGLNGQNGRHKDLDAFFGSGALEDEVLKAIEEHDVVHPDEAN